MVLGVIMDGWMDESIHAAHNLCCSQLRAGNCQSWTFSFPSTLIERRATGSERRRDRPWRPRGGGSIWRGGGISDLLSGFWTFRATPGRDAICGMAESESRSPRGPAAGRAKMGWSGAARGQVGDRPFFSVCMPALCPGPTAITVERAMAPMGSRQKLVRGWG